RVKVADGTLPSGLQQWVDYHVVNVNGNSFQLSATAGGPAIDFGADYTGEVYLGATGPVWENMWHDPSVVAWQDYAEQNIAEARKFGKTVNTWLSPSFAGAAINYLEPDFFRWQLELTKSLSDSITIYDYTGKSTEFHQQQGWVTALADFMATLDDPAATISISVGATSTPVTTVPPPAGTPDGNVTPPVVDAAPEPADDVFSLNEDQTLRMSVSTLLANDANLTGSSRFEIVSRTEHGSLSHNANGVLVYHPDANFAGTDHMTYRIQSEDGTYSPTATVTLNVHAVNDRPIAVADRLEAEQGTMLKFTANDLLANDVDAEHQSLVAEIVKGPANGTLRRAADGSFEYLGNAGFSGTDEVTYRVSDGALQSLVTTVAIEVAPRILTPVVNHDSFVTAEDKPLMLALTDLLSDVNGIDMSRLSVEFLDQPDHGTIGRSANGSIVYTPAANFHGVDRFGYRVSSDGINSDLIAVQVRVSPVNDAPVGNTDLYRIRSGSSLSVRDGGVLANDRDVDGDTLRARLLNGPAHGVLKLLADGSFEYRPNNGFVGTDSFQYRVIDASGASSIAKAYVRVEASNATASKTAPAGGLTLLQSSLTI
ncbi:MAG: tandem-95 repeat protein, partial [Planctomycetales bacterium]|nr:tandem-95 repeat protein [Planctomycetales bacterium]